MLVEALPEHYIFSQVSFNALITHAPHVWSKEAILNVRMKFNAKYVDFVICNKMLEVVSIVEYDGYGHNTHADTYRDSMLRAAGYHVERFTPKDSFDTIKERLDTLEKA